MYRRNSIPKLMTASFIACFCVTVWQISGARAEGPLSLQEMQSANFLEGKYNDCIPNRAEPGIERTKKREKEAQEQLMKCALDVFGSNTSFEILDHVAQQMPQDEIASFWILEKEIRKYYKTEEQRRFSAWLDHYWTETTYRPTFTTNATKEIKEKFRFIAKYPFRKIDLSNNGGRLHEDDIEYVQDLLEESETLEELNYSGNYLGYLGPNRIKKGLKAKKSKLKVLILDNAYMMDSEFRSLMTTILKHKTLKSVSFKNCGFNFSHFGNLVLHFEDAKVINHTLERIDVSGNIITEQQFKIFQNLISQFFTSVKF